MSEWTLESGMDFALERTRVGLYSGESISGWAFIWDFTVL